MIRKRKPSNLKILAWNANSLTKRRQEFIELVKRLNIDIALVGETHWREGDSFNIPNYSTYKQTRDRRAGGTAVFIKTNIEHYQIDVTPPERLETTAVMVYTSSMGKVKIAACYYPPGKTFHDNDYTRIMQGMTPTLIAGDLNAKHTSWNSRICNAYGHSLRRLSDHHAWVVMPPDAPTRYHPNGFPDILDIAMGKNIPLPVTVTTLDELSSDHNPLLIQFGE